MSVFNELDHRLSVVDRWGILHTIQRQSVAEHVHNVVRIAKRIAVEWFDVDDPAELLDIIEYAHHHDDFEALSGDLPSMIKPYFREELFEKDHSHLIRKYTPVEREDTAQIVKLADKLEGWHFLCIEMALGNVYVQNHYAKEPGIIRDYVRGTWPGNDALYDNVCRTIDEMVLERSTRFSMRGR